MTITSCDESISGDITIPATLGGYPVTAIDGWAFYYCYDLTTVTIPVSQPVDYDKNDAINEDDVIYLLQHLLMPEDFPLT